MTAPAEPTLAEIGRQLQELREDLRELRGELVRTDVYRAEQRTVEQRMHSIETRLAVSEEDRKALRRMVIGAGIAAIASMLVNMVAGVLQGIGAG